MGRNILCKVHPELVGAIPSQKAAGLDFAHARNITQPPEIVSIECHHLGNRDYVITHFYGTDTVTTNNGETVVTRMLSDRPDCSAFQAKQTFVMNAEGAVTSSELMPLTLPFAAVLNVSKAYCSRSWEFFKPIEVTNSCK